MRRCLAFGAVLACALISLLPQQSVAQCRPVLDQPPLARKGSLLGAINPTVAPIQYIDDSGNLVGLDVDFGNALAQRLCLKMEFVSTQFAVMIPTVKEGRVDMIDSFMFYTPERASQVLMVPYGASSGALLVPKSNSDSVTSFDYFAGKRFGTELGSIDDQQARAASAVLVKAGKPPIDVHTFASYADVLQALAAGQVDGAFVGTEQAFYYEKKGQTFFRIALSGYMPHVEALAFAKPEIADAVVKVMNDMKADGSFDKIFAPYRHCVLPGPYKVTTGPIQVPSCPSQGQ